MSRWNRRRVIIVDEFIGFPKEIAHIVTEYCMEPRLLPWIPRDKLDWDYLLSNPKALEAEWFDVRTCNSFWFANNPGAGEIIKGDIDRYVNESSIWENPSVFEYLLEIQILIDDKWFCLNPHPKAVAMIISGAVEMDLEHFNENPGAIDWLRAHPESRDSGCICANPMAIDIIQALPAINYYFLSKNPHPWAIEQLRTHQDDINWNEISANPGIFEYRMDSALWETLTHM